ncbi:MAG: glycosyltransferase family 1 protein, partial [Snowella sp.]
QDYAEIMTKLSQGKHPNILSLPVFSNIGEPKLEQLQPLTQRSKRLIIFGGRGTRSRVYQRSVPALEQTCRELQIEEIYDIGPPLGVELPLINQTAVKSLGVKSSHEISHLLSDSIVGFFDYSLEFLAKSTIFAAYCAHRLLPVGAFYPGKDVDDLIGGKHYWIADTHPDPMSLIPGQLVAENAYAWYQQHQLSVQAQVFINSL